jgi:hypothetical protein
MVSGNGHASPAPLTIAYPRNGIAMAELQIRRGDNPTKRFRFRQPADRTRPRDMTGADAVLTVSWKGTTLTKRISEGAGTWVGLPDAGNDGELVPAEAQFPFTVAETNRIPAGKIATWRLQTVISGTFRTVADGIVNAI